LFLLRHQQVQTGSEIEMMLKARASTETMSGGGIESAKAEAEAGVGKDAESVEMMTTRGE
jgi:hypothetical protein